MTHDRPPNVLFLMSDQHRADVLGYAGNAVVRTPTLDRLARGGVAFSNAYTPSPICVPGRQAMMSGQFPRTCGSERYGQDLSPGHMTFARRFSQHAYQTVACGKLHHMGHDQLQGWLRLIGMHENLDEAYIEGRDVDAFARITEDQEDGPWGSAKEIRRAGVGRGRTVVHDAYAVQGALNYIDEFFCDPWYDRARPRRPILLKVSLEHPHIPFQCDEEKFTYYLNRVEPFDAETPFDHPFLGRDAVLPGRDVTPREIRRATAAYYGMVEQTDAYFGQIVDRLEHVGQNLADWIVVYCSDHGEMLGEHAAWGKRKFFEASVRVPLIIRWPRRFGSRVVTQNVNLCDLFATLCELTNLPTPPDLDSRSLVPLLQGETDAWDDETVSQFDGRNLMVKQGPLKYLWHGPDEPEALFDLEADPAERSNRINDAKYAAALAGFRARRRELGFDATTETDPHGRSL